MRQLTGAIRGELVRLTRTRLIWWTLIAAALCGGGLVGLVSLTGPENATPPMPGLDTVEGVSGVLSLLSVTLFVPALIGTAAISGEYRHRTVATTFLAIPRRGQVLIAKLVAYSALGLGYGLAFALTAVAGLYAGSALHGGGLGLGVADVVGTVSRYGAAAAIYMLLGVGIGAIARNQFLAIGLTLGYFYLVENLIMIVPGVNMAYPFLPGGAASALTGSTALLEMIAAETGQSGPAIQAPLIGALVLLGYALMSSALAAAVSLRRDVT
ncbi:ABC-2 family transporter [Nocardioides albertanoniae]|uniref:ABC-2 family transporter n=1 Tax=Nocardioides albertanoniae TaxID=1175486 RepID=A0A543A3S4_9ACTN|nr:ABC transporter permease [Nocardioides albertanoniae]TQL67245.1 ABC-2 family transporter [Nocardioides albertanoniae]